MDSQKSFRGASIKNDNRQFNDLVKRQVAKIN